MTDSGKAVFLSYASQDASAAQNLCNALRAAGVEVWFDLSELRGGDAWDATIRRQIKGCYLFVPIISANTQSREEGYFRREWNLAVARTLDMAEDRSFLLPLVIDGTSDSEARVPEKFREVQWTRLPAGSNTDAFVDHVRRLLAPEATTPAAAPLRPAPNPTMFQFTMGHRKESDLALEQLTQVGADDWASGIALVHAIRGESDAAFKWLDRAYAQKDEDLYLI